MFCTITTLEAVPIVLRIVVAATSTLNSLRSCATSAKLTLKQSISKNWLVPRKRPEANRGAARPAANCCIRAAVSFVRREESSIYKYCSYKWCGKNVHSIAKAFGERYSENLRFGNRPAVKLSLKIYQVLGSVCICSSKLRCKKRLIWIINYRLYRSFRAIRSGFCTPINALAESVGRLDQKFFGRRVETMVCAPRPQSRVFSKNL
jgi:hypothetical protein